MTLPLENRHALVCGASEGIGRAAAQALAEAGATITLLARRTDALVAAVATLPALSGQQHAWIAADMRDTAGLRERIETLAAERPVHILVNNSAGPSGGPAHSAKVEDFEAVFRQHLLAAQVSVQAVLPGMRAAQWGRIVNVISTSVKEPIANLGISNTIRGAVAAWAKTLASELGPDGITVNNVLPGATLTQRHHSLVAKKATQTGEPAEAIEAAMLGLIPAKRFGHSEEVAAAVAFLAGPAAGYINGTSVPVDGGRTGSL